MYKVKRMGPNDSNDIIWMYSKIHGLENIAFLTDEQIQTISDPMTLQRAINNVRKPDRVFQSYEEMVEHNTKNLSDLKEAVNWVGLYPSDRQKLLSLPFYLAKRRELPSPKKGQWQWNLFEEIYGKPWNEY